MSLKRIDCLWYVTRLQVNRISVEHALETLGAPERKARDRVRRTGERRAARGGERGAAGGKSRAGSGRGRKPRAGRAPGGGRDASPRGNFQTFIIVSNNRGIQAQDPAFNLRPHF